MSSAKLPLKKFSKSEIRVSEYLVSRGWKLLFHDVEILGVQIDLLMRAPEGTLTILEVKSGSALARLAPAQKRRLIRISNFLAQWEPVDLQLAFVSRLNLRLLPVDPALTE